MSIPFTFQKWVNDKQHQQAEFANMLVCAYLGEHHEKEYGVSLNAQLHPVAIVEDSINIKLLSPQICLDEWITHGSMVFECDKIGLGKSDGFVFVKLPEAYQPNKKSADWIIGFVMNSDALYDVHGKTRIRGRIPSVKKVVKVESSKKDKYWEVLVYDDDTYSCNCPAWKFKGRDCKHVRKVK